VEARSRLGGRVWTEAVGTDPVELGPEWFERNGAVARLVRLTAGTITGAAGPQLLRTSEGWQRNRQHKIVPRLLRQLRRHAGIDQTLTAAVRTRLSAADQAIAARHLLPYVEGFHAADPDRLSSRWLEVAEASQSAGDADARTIEGLGRIVDELARRVRAHASVRLDAPVRSIRWKPGGVEVCIQGDGEPLTARAAVVTLPLGVLQSGEPRFEPALQGKQEPLGLLQTGHVKKVVFSFRSAFWTDAGVPDALFLQDYRLPFPTWWFPADPSQTMLTAWAGGPQAQRITGQDDSISATAIDALARLLAVPRSVVERELIQLHYHDWDADPYARGAYSYVAAGGLGAPAMLARPIANTLYFAGEATCSAGMNATMDGALESGWRAAAEVLAMLEGAGTRPARAGVRFG
jgi:monoamine oxidase